MKAMKEKGIVAWIINWEHYGNHVGLQRELVAGILNRRTSEKTVTQFMELLYSNTLTRCPEERLAYAKDERFRPEHYVVCSENGRITLLGPNPSLEARKVANLRVSEGRLTWDEKPRPQR